ncbi:FAD-dependent monooxygenase [Actinocrispum wychmicini]|uniref:2-polyprenyl-6-methoxyphenol hydroxylase-like FAD-dependent oxidoreductase n=1 Tax=Actinocrispum wychmicini TaxID=1213861 RepID=A0A4R2JGP7_9PSEU|nr:FAD-dependent monooxygenase [Actinocrispum wychmicini]TCO56078.1 2-polyprenyl-6-methoxyphenol hydroxylase-like FAD-dependent oxidoreductase [Actinocrispum wychmicini]
MTGGRAAVVAGGGIGGLATGIILRRNGFHVTVVEQAGRLGQAGSGIMLYPNGVKALDVISPRLGRAVRAAGHVAGPAEVRPLLTPDGAVFAADPVGRLASGFGAPQISLLRSALLGALLREAWALGLGVRSGVAVDDHVDDGDQVKVVLADGQVLVADLLVGADGIHSGVRERTLADGPPRYRGFTTVRCRTRAPAEFPSGFVVKGPGLDIFAAPVGGGDLYWTAKIMAAAGVWPAMTPADAFAELVTLVADWDTTLAGVIRGTDIREGIVVTDIRDRDPVADWSRGLVTLLGDAAHPMTPALGQGAGMAFEDAVVLTAALLAQPDTSAALAAYPEERAARIADVVQLSRWKGPDGDPAAFNTHEERLAELYGWQAPAFGSE